MSIAATPHRVTSGESVEVSGVVRCPGGESSGQTVTVYENIAGVPGSFKVLGTATSGAGGLYTLSPAPVLVTDTTFYAAVTGSHSGRKTVKVAPVVTSGTSPALAEGAQLFTGRAHEVTFTGTVNPTEDVGAEVVLQRESATSTEEWGPIQLHNYVQPGGTYTIVHRFLVPGDANLRVIVRPHGKFDTRGVSSTMTYEVSQAQNPNLTLEPSSDPAVYGQTVTLKGIVKAGAGQKVALAARVFGKPGFSPAGEATSGPGGVYEFTVPNLKQSTYYKVSSGAVHSAVLFEGVRWSVGAPAVTFATTGVTAASVPSGEIATFSGTVSPGRGGHFVYLERQDTTPGGGWHVVDLGVVTASSEATGTYTIAYPVIGRGKQVYRIKVPGDPINQGAASTPVELTVNPPMAPVLRPTLQPTLPR